MKYPAWTPPTPWLICTETPFRPVLADWQRSYCRGNRDGTWTTITEWCLLTP